MIQLTQKGKEIYGDREIDITEVRKADYDYLMYVIVRYANAGGANNDGTPKLKVVGHTIIASTPLELKALLDMDLIEIK